MHETRPTDQASIRQKLLNRLQAGVAGEDLSALLAEATGLKERDLERLLREVIGAGLDELKQRPDLHHGCLPESLYQEKLGSSRIANVSADIASGSSAPISIKYGFAAGWYGDCLIAATEKGLCSLDLCPGAAGLQELQAAFPGALLVQDDMVAREFADAVFGRQQEKIAVHLIGTEFQIRVWQALPKIPAGTCMTYGKLAQCIAAPNAARAVGRAVGSNRIAVVVPCHRVLPANGRPGEFRWGTAIKWALLMREQLFKSESVRFVA